MSEARIISLILCTVFLLVTVVGSGFSVTENIEGIDTNAAMSAYRADTVMLSAGDLSITWDIIYFYLHNTVGQLTYGFQEDIDWSEIIETGETWAEAVKASVLERAEYDLAHMYGISLTGATLSDEELEHMRTLVDSMVLEIGSLALLEEDMRLNGFMNLSVYESLFEQYVLQEKLVSILYGDTYSDIPDEVVEDYAQRNGFMLAKHILLTFPTEYSELTPEETEASKAEKREKIEEILSDLNAHKNDNLEEYFDTLIREHSEDPGSFNYPDGYLFQSGDMVEAFSNACEALLPGQMSGIVESSYGYHIILRLPLDYDNIVPFSFAYSGQNFSLRNLAVFEDYDNLVSLWRDSLDFKLSPEMDALDVGKLFAWRN